MKKNTVKNVIQPLFFILAVLFSIDFLFAQNAVSKSAAQGFAEDEFRRGVQAYYRGTYNDAVLEFEKALSYLPEEGLIIEWLGDAYYMAGMEGTALQEWQYAVDAGYGGLLLKNKIEIVRERRVPVSQGEEKQRFIEAGIFHGIYNDNQIFSQPISVLPEKDGTAWVLAYGSNELLKFDVNGLVVNRITGPLNGFDRPVDLLEMNDDNILVSESAGDRLCVISQAGFFKKYIGTKGRGVGQLIGPQYMDQDDLGNIYVSDFGNMRIDVFDKDGNGLFFFGGKTDNFEGLQGPTGISVIGSVVYVADSVSGGIYEFDTAGNYLGVLVPEKTYKHPESMKKWNDYLLLCDSNKVYSIDISTGAIYENVNTGNAPSRLTSAVPDVNGNILITDLKTNEIYVMSKMSELVGGFFVQIVGVNADDFPNVTIGLKVENRHRKPVVGLRKENFLLTENKRPVTNQQLSGSASANDSADITIIVDRSVAAVSYSDAVQTAVHETAKAMNGKGTLRILSASSVPVNEYEGSPLGALQFTTKMLAAGECKVCRLDSAIRLAANKLITGDPKRSIIYLTAGTVTEHAFENYSLSDLSAYLNNNSIGFTVINLTQTAPAEEISYLCSSTTGGCYYVYRPAGLSPIIENIISTPSGYYQLSYTSTLSTDLGRKFLPVEAEVYLLNRSGRDESGYFSPLQ